MQRVLVTGGYGYIGSHIVKAAYEAGYHVDVIDKCKSKNDIEPYCDIISIGVTKKFQKMNYGKKLVEYLKNLNFRNIYVEVSANNKNAIIFYQKLNFLKIGLRKNYYKKQRSDAILFKLENFN